MAYMYTVINLPTKYHSSGSIIVAEVDQNIPFIPKRAYWIVNTNNSDTRGNHAHKSLKQLIIAVNGSVDILLTDGKSQEILILDSPSKGLLIEGLTWRVFSNFKNNCILHVLCDQKYEEDDYIRNYDDFIKYALG